jgi:DNA end-binding protein Ku
MARALWSGSVSFGLVNVPVALFSAARDLDVHFHQIHEPSKARIEVRRVCSKEGKEVPWEEIAHGWSPSHPPTKCVMVTDDELASLEPRRTKTIDIEAFVELEEIDPVHFDHPYLLAPTGGEGAARAYALLAKVMERSGRVAIGRFVLRSKEYLVALRVREGAIALSTLLFADEIREVPSDAKPKAKPKKSHVDEAVRLIKELSCDFDPDSYEDRHRQRLEKLVAQKKKGKEIEIPEDPETPEPVSDLMDALRESLKAARSGSLVG